MRSSVLTQLVIALTTASAVCLGQDHGPAVDLNNFEAKRPIYYGTLGNLAAGSDFYAEVLGGPDADHLQPLSTSIGVTISTNGLGPDGPGYFDVGIGIVPGLDSTKPGLGTFQVLAWKGASTFDAAAPHVASAIWTQMTGYMNPPPELPSGGVLEVPTNLVIPAVPEPAITTLWLAAFVALLVIRWRR